MPASLKGHTGAQKQVELEPWIDFSRWELHCLLRRRRPGTSKFLARARLFDVGTIRPLIGGLSEEDGTLAALAKSGPSSQAHGVNQ